MIASLILAVVGMYALAAAMPRHHHTLRLPGAGERRPPRGFGWLALAASWVAATVDLGAALGSLTWLGLLSVASGLIVLLAGTRAPPARR